LIPKKGIRSIVKEAHKNTTTSKDNGENKESDLQPTQNTVSWKVKVSRIMSQFITVDSMFSLVRIVRRVIVWSTATAVKSIRAASTLSLVPDHWEQWANQQQNAILQASRLDWTQEAINALLDVHGYQILNQGLFNADPHPGNILVVQDENNPKEKPKIGLIDYGQCKRLTTKERVKIAKLIVSIADKEPDEVIATNFRNLGIKTKNNSTKFLAEFGRLMFGAFQPKHLDHSWHKELHKEDLVVYFPNELSMVYRTSLLLRGLAMSLQFNPSVGEQWRQHAQETIDQYGMLLLEES